MSGLGRVPSFEPDEEAKAMIESMFATKKEVKLGEEYQMMEEEDETKPKSNITPGKRHRVRIPEPAEQTEEQQEAAIALVNEEINLIHDAFMEFSEQTSDTVIYGYLYSEILKLVEAFKDMDDMVNEAINKEKITENGMEWYEQMKKIRARVLNDVYNKYKDEK